MSSCESRDSPKRRGTGLEGESTGKARAERDESASRACIR